MALKDLGTVQDALGWWQEWINLMPCMAFLEQNGQIIQGNRAAQAAVRFEEPVGCHYLLGEAYKPAGVCASGEQQRFDCWLTKGNGEKLAMSAAARAVEHAGERYGLILLMERFPCIPASDGEAVLVEEMLEAIPEPSAMILDGLVLHVNRAFVRMLGYAASECVGQDLAEMVIPDGRLHDIEVLEHQLLRHDIASIDSKVRTRAGEEVDVQVEVTPIHLDGRIGRTLIVRFRDIRQQKRDEARLLHKALHDALTGLPNRTLFLDRLRLTLSRLKRRPDRNFAVMFLDLDRFKQVNDTFGHAAGDALLLAVKDRLLCCLRPQDTVARFGGDEFALLLDEQGSIEDAEAVARRLQSEVQKPVDLEGREANVSLSIGVAMGTPTYMTAEEMMNDADRAMYEAKTQGRARHVVFEGRRAG